LESRFHIFIPANRPEADKSRNPVLMSSSGLPPEVTPANAEAGVTT